MGDMLTPLEIGGTLSSAFLFSMNLNQRFSVKLPMQTKTQTDSKNYSYIE